MSQFEANSLPVLIGSLPHRNHEEAVRLIFAYTEQIPLWPQLPFYKEEGMLLQFLPGLPGITRQGGKTYIDSSTPEFADEFLRFFEDYLAVVEGAIDLEESRFAMSPQEAAGFSTFLQEAEQRQHELTALKGQLTGPITFSTGLADQDGRALFYDEQLRDAAVKLLALRARYQTRKMAQIKQPPLIFFDEPGLAGFGSSAFITITPEDINGCLREVYEGVREEGGMTGVHVCANTEWSVIFATGVDIVSFDAYSYFDKLILFADQLVSFFDRGGILASGIVPTAPAFIEQEDSESLVRKWLTQVEQLEKIGITRETVFRQTLITPSCGTGTVTEAQNLKVMEMTRDVSTAIRDIFLT